MSNLRSSPRVRTFKSGRLVLNDGRSTLDCIVRNLSETGARLSFPQAVDLPDLCDIILADGVRRPCRIGWRRSLEIGISFEDLTGPPGTIVSR